MDQTVEIPVSALRAGDRQAFAQMVEAHSPFVFRLAVGMLHDKQEAEDVLQETFLNAYRGLRSFEGRPSLSTWLYRIATNQALNGLRQNGQGTACFDEPAEKTDDDQLPRQIEDWRCLPEAEFMSAVAQQQLDAAVGGLSPALRAVFVLRDLQGLSAEETARVLDLSSPVVKTRLLRARLHLRELLTGTFAEHVREGDNA
jgi:RNA polymerase sigma-70 factor (ECF subfamily)